MRVFNFFILLALLVSLTGCYIGAEPFGEAGVYYKPPYYRQPYTPSTYWIESAPVDYSSYPEDYPFWY